jgi:type IV pilus assembly protein PilB
VAPKASGAPLMGGLFAWTPIGIGAVAVGCAHCGAEAKIHVAESLLEALCGRCGNNLALGLVRARLEREGPESLRESLQELGLELEDDEAPLGIEQLLASGQLQRDLCLTLELDADAGQHRYAAAPLASLALPEEVEEALAERAAHGGTLAEGVRSKLLARLAASVRAVGPQAGLPCLSASDLPAPAEITELLPPRARRELGALPLRRAGGRLVIAVADPLDATLGRDLEGLTGEPVELILAERELLAQVEPKESPADSRRLKGDEDLESEPSGELELAEANLGPDPLETVLLEALEEGAESLRIEPRDGVVGLRLCVRGVLRAPRLLPREVADALLERLAGSAHSPPGALQRASSRWEVSGLPVELAARWIETPFGPSLHVRLSEDAPRPLPLGHLGLGFQPLAAFERALARGGLIVLGAQSARERSQAYLGALARIARLGGEVVSLEAKVRHYVTGAAQLEPSAVSDLAQLSEPPPDWICLDGTLRPETLRLALDVVSAGGGALITVPARDAESALLRLELEGAPRALLDRLLSCALARQVLRPICPHCRYQRSPSQEWVGLGCPACDDGVTGDLPIAELLTRGSISGPSLAEQLNELREAGRI